MTQSDTDSSGLAKEARLPLRDWFLLPLISLLTISLLSASTEMIARRVFTHTETFVGNCMVLDDPSTGTRGIPGCECWEKSDEGQLVEYRFNHSGYRADVEFGPRPSGTYRIVTVGSSYLMGRRVPIEQTLSTLLSTELSRRAGRRVELFNEGMGQGGGTARFVAQHLNDALEVKPDMILWALNPWDTGNVSNIMPVQKKTRIEHGQTKRHLEEALATGSVPDFIRVIPDAVIQKIRDFMEDTRTALMVRHFLFENQSQYLRSYLMEPDDQAGFLKAHLSLHWRDNLKQFDNYAAEIEGRTSDAGVPLAAVLLPNRAQAAMISMGEWPAGYDPYKLNNELRSIITSHGGIYIDILPGFRNIPNPEQYYFPVDGHPNAGGHKIIADLLAKELTRGAIPELKATAEPQAVLGQRR